MENNYKKGATLRFNVEGKTYDIRMYMSFSESVNLWGGMRDRYKVRMSVDGYVYRTKYNKSIMDYQKGNREVTDEDLAFSLYCILSDALCYYEASSYYEFEKEFGGDYRTYNACRMSYDRVTDLISPNVATLVEIQNMCDDKQYEIVKR